jgi:hypothetical protein
MLIIIIIGGALLLLLGIVVIPKLRVPGGVNDKNLGWMSEQWLAEHRASRR